MTQSFDDKGVHKKNIDFLGYTIETVDSVDSTNTELIRRMNAGSIGHGYVLLANEQTNGKGRRGRVWLSERGNLFFSIALDTKSSPEHLPQLSFVSALTTHAVLSSLGLFPTLKWPNDLLLEGKKCCGILLEKSNFSSSSVVLGVGLNTKITPSDNSKILYPATSIEEYLKEDTFSDNETLLRNWLEQFTKYYDIWDKDGFSPIRNEWLKYGHQLGEALHIILPKGDIHGTFNDLDAEGNLLLKNEAGQIVCITAGDVFIV